VIASLFCNGPECFESFIILFIFINSHGVKSRMNEWQHTLSGLDSMMITLLFMNEKASVYKLSGFFYFLYYIFKIVIKMSQNLKADILSIYFRIKYILGASIIIHTLLISVLGQQTRLSLNEKDFLKNTK
jgi:hypothetical protein